MAEEITTTPTFTQESVIPPKPSSGLFGWLGGGGKLGSAPPSQETPVADVLGPINLDTANPAVATDGDLIDVNKADPVVSIPGHTVSTGGETINTSGEPAIDPNAANPVIPPEPTVSTLEPDIVVNDASSVIKTTDGREIPSEEKPVISVNETGLGNNVPVKTHAEEARIESRVARLKGGSALNDFVKRRVEAVLGIRA